MWALVYLATIAAYGIAAAKMFQARRWLYGQRWSRKSSVSVTQAIVASLAGVIGVLFWFSSGMVAVRLFILLPEQVPEITHFVSIGEQLSAHPTPVENYLHRHENFALVRSTIETASAGIFVLLVVYMPEVLVRVVGKVRKKRGGEGSENVMGDSACADPVRTGAKPID